MSWIAGGSATDPRARGQASLFSRISSCPTTGMLMPGSWALLPEQVSESRAPQPGAALCRAEFDGDSFRVACVW